jgi:hypothetical protein
MGLCVVPHCNPSGIFQKQINSNLKTSIARLAIPRAEANMSTHMAHSYLPVSPL